MFGRALASWSLQSCAVSPFSPLPFFDADISSDSARTREAVAQNCPRPWQLLFRRSEPWTLGAKSSESREIILDLVLLLVVDWRLGWRRRWVSSLVGRGVRESLFRRKRFLCPTGKLLRCGAQDFSDSQLLLPNPQTALSFLKVTWGNLGPKGPLNL